MEKKEKIIIDKFFSFYPPCHAIPRANEALALRKIKLPEPILDLGCGDGRFAKFAFGQKINVGIDFNKKEVIKARQTAAYIKTIVADAGKLPFKKEVFASVIANSVLEHAKDLDRVLQEVVRVLKKNGIFVLTVPDLLVSDYQFWSKFIPGYAKFKAKIWRHINYFGKKKWLEKLNRAGLKTISVKRINSKSAIMYADLFFPLFPLGPMKFLTPFFEKRKVFSSGKIGATFLIVAEKNENK